MQLIQLSKMYIIPKDTTEQNKQKKAYCLPFIHSWFSACLENKYNKVSCHTIMRPDFDPPTIQPLSQEKKIGLHSPKAFYTKISYITLL